MTLTKNKIVREIGRRTRMTNRDIQIMLESLVEIWTEELVSGGRIELEGFLVIETREVDRGRAAGVLNNGHNQYPAPRLIRKVNLRASKRLKTLLNHSNHIE